MKLKLQTILYDLPTMAATPEQVEAILKQLKVSGLNFHIEESPYSAVISLKKSHHELYQI